MATHNDGAAPPEASCRGLMLGCAVGDALGFPYEGGPPEEAAAAMAEMDGMYPQSGVIYPGKPHACVATARMHGGAVLRVLTPGVSMLPCRVYSPTHRRCFISDRREGCNSVYR